MIILHEIDPIAFYIGPFDIRWYGITYLVAIALAWVLGLYRAKQTSSAFWHQQAVSDLIFYTTIGLVLGGRLGYMIFYDWAQWIENPFTLFKIRQGGMSFHGGLLGASAAMWFFAKKYRINFWRVTDFVAPLVPLGLAAGRIGNYINGELWGKVTDGSWGVIFPLAGSLPRHPSQLYEACLEGICLFIGLWIYSIKPRPMMAVSAFFLIGYSLARISVEFFREPDFHLGYIWGWITQGQLLSIPMVVGGLVMLALAYRQPIMHIKNRPIVSQSKE